MLNFGELNAIVAAYGDNLDDEAEVIIKGKGPQVHHVYAEQTTTWCGERDGLRTTQRLVIIGEG